MSGCSVDSTGLSMAGLVERAADNFVPLQALVEVTGRCHMDCVHCYLDIKNPLKNELSLAELDTLFVALKSAGTLFLTITGGEIFLRKDIFEIIESAKKHRFSVRLFTSGTLLDREKIARIAALAPSAVEISVYGMRSNVHDAITQRPGSLRKSLRAAVLLRQAGVAVAIKSPMLEGTDGAHFELIDAARRIGAGYSIDPSIMTRRDGGTEPLSSRPSVEKIAELFSDPRLANVSGPLPGPRSPSEAPCAIARRVVRIAPNGDVFPCSAFPVAAGNLRDQSFDEIWKDSPVLNEIRGVTLGDLQGECSDCSRQGYCGRCNAQALMEHGNFAGPSSEACDRAEAKEMAAGVSAPPGARRIEAEPLGRRPMEKLVPVGRLVRPRPSSAGSPD